MIFFFNHVGEGWSPVAQFQKPNTINDIIYIDSIFENVQHIDSHHEMPNYFCCEIEPNSF